MSLKVGNEEVFDGTLFFLLFKLISKTSTMDSGFSYTADIHLISICYFLHWCIQILDIQPRKQCGYVDVYSDSGHSASQTVWLRRCVFRFWTFSLSKQCGYVDVYSDSGHSASQTVWLRRCVFCMSNMPLVTFISSRRGVNVVSEGDNQLLFQTIETGAV
ncbi:hypothetical protein CEXT_391141 [Caerostris extrusa]|uniref:Uncharacterized protein n=1 Tax=Caerostris extrusa TaxID=172846 RepID=A0AAV4Y3Z8_CAEEX|nr:hypothetical protein CEXT_391141 [Caerostris extrusa]